MTISLVSTISAHRSSSEFTQGENEIRLKLLDQRKLMTDEVRSFFYPNYENTPRLNSIMRN